MQTKPKMKQEYIKINEPFRMAWKWYNWKVQEPGIGIYEERLKGEGHLDIELNGKVLTITKDKARKVVEKYNAYYTAKGFRLGVIPMSALEEVKKETDEERGDRLLRTALGL